MHEQLFFTLFEYFVYFHKPVFYFIIFHFPNDLVNRSRSLMTYLFGAFNRDWICTRWQSVKSTIIEEGSKSRGPKSIKSWEWSMVAAESSRRSVYATAGKIRHLSIATHAMRLFNDNNCDDRIVSSYDICHVQSTRDWHISAFNFFLLLSARTRFDPRDSHCWRSLTERGTGRASRSGYCTFNVASLGNNPRFGRKRSVWTATRAFIYTRACARYTRKGPHAYSVSTLAR